MVGGFDPYAFAADDVAATRRVVTLTPAVWERVDRACHRRGRLASGVEGSLHEFAVLAWLSCRAVWAHGKSPAYVQSVGYLAQVTQLEQVSAAVSRLVKRHTPPDRRSVTAPGVDPAQLATGFAFLADATIDEVGALVGVERDRLMRIWPPAPRDE